MRELLDHEAVIASATRTPSCLSELSSDTGSDNFGTSETGTSVVLEEVALSIMFSTSSVVEILLYHPIGYLGETASLNTHIVGLGVDLTSWL